jgi:putative hydrolase of the HAD superfamily
MIKLLIFDWGNTLMRDFTQFEGPMASWPKIEIIQNADSVLQKLFGKYTLCVASNAGVSDTLLMRKALERGGLEKYFTFYFSSKDLGFAKPDPAFFLEILSQSGFIAAESVMIGNDYIKDIEGAKLAGLKTIFFNEENIEGDYSGADEIINEMSDLPCALLKINICR